MNVLPNSFVTNSSSSVNLITTIPASATISRQTDQNNRSVILKCAACKNLLLNNNDSNNGKTNSYSMLAVRPTIGSGSKDPFFPILETLTHTSAVHVPCCWNCTESLLEQWNEFENKNIPIKNRVYNLSSSVNNVNYDKSTTTTNMIIVDNHQNNKTLLLSSSAPIIKSRIQAHPISLSNNNNGNLISNSPKIDCNSNSSNSTTPSSQDEVLDLSMTSSNSTTILKNDSIPFTTKTEFVVIPSATSLNSTTLNLSTNNKIPTTNVTAVLNVSPSSISQSNTIGSRPKNASTSSSSNSNSDNNVITISPYLNSSMTNLIKVSSSPVALNLKPLSTIETTVNNNINHSSSSSPILAKKPLLSCALCEESCPTLYSIMLRPMGNCPYFPSLTPLVKINSFDSTGKISVCESCHHQLILQWDAHQKNNKPILERQYQLIKSSSSTTTKHNSLIVGQVTGQNPEVSSNNIVTNNTQNITNNNTRSQNIPPISQSFVSIVAANKTFSCIICGNDLIHNAQQNPSNKSSHIAFSIQSENDTNGNVITKKLIIQSAQEINLMPFLSQSTSMHLHQLQLLNESGRVLICGVCFETITSRCSINNNNINNSDNSNIYNSLQLDQNEKSIVSTNRSSHDSLNGTMTTKILTTIVNNNQSINNDDQSSLLCLACNHHKYQYLVETKENSMKKPFFPFLHDPNEPNGRARLCAPCHLMLETQWDAYENSYVPYNQRAYRLSSTTNSQSTLITTASKRSLPPSLPISSITTTTGHNISSPQTQVVNGQQSTPPPLKIQIAVPNQASLPSSSQPIVVDANSNVNLSSDHLLLTTVQHQPTIKNVSNDVKSDQYFFKFMNDLLANLGGPHPTISGTCSICHQHSPEGNSYQLFSTSRNIVISAELGVYPFFPFLKLNNTSNNSLKKNSKNSASDNPYVACTYCYHLLISQWTTYQVSSKPEDRDLSSRHYNCHEFVCYVCGVTTYRHFIRTMPIKDFPFLLEHKRPRGSITINKGECVVTCLTCYQTLIEQWTENERMKVPLEMRKYNWMRVPQPPPPSSSSSSVPTPSSIIKTNNQQQPEQKLFVLQRHSIPERTIIPILTNTSTLSYQINANSINPNGIISVPASATSDMITKAIIVNTSGGGVANFQPSNNSNDVQLKSSTISNNNMNVVAPRFSPSHTLAPLVAAAMAATPVTIKQENINQNNNSDPVINNTTNTTIVPENNISIGANTNSLRKLALKQPFILHKIQDPQSINDHQIKEYREQQQVQYESRSSSINLTTLASVAALAGNRNHSPQFVTNKLTTHSISENNKNNIIKQHSELPKAVINSNSFAIHFNALSDNNSNNVGKISKKIDEQNFIRKNAITIVNNTHHPNNHDTQQQHHHNHSSRAAQIRELEEVSADSNIDTSLSQVNLEVIKLRKKRIARLNKFKEDQIKTETDLQSDLSDAELTEIDDNRSIFEPINFLNINTNSHKPRRDSIVKFLAKVAPVLPLNKNAKDKADFLSHFGLTTNKREREWEMFVEKKLSRRLSTNSYKVDWFEENEKSILEIDPYYDQLLKYGAHFSSSDLYPDSDLLKIQQKQSIINDKNDFVSSLDLKPNSNDRQLKNEIDWLAVIRNRHFRRKYGIVCCGKIYNNLKDQVLNTWIPELSSKSLSSSSSSSFDSELIKKFERCLPLNYDLENEENLIDNNTNNNILNENDEHHDQEMESSCSNHQISKTIINQQQEKKIVISELNHHQNNDLINNYQHRIVTSITLDNQKMDQRHDNTVTIINNNNNSINNGNNNKIINSKQFAQEFHESVLLETQKQMSKHNGNLININNNNNNSVINNNINHHHYHHHQDGANHNHNAQAIIYSEQLKQTGTTILNDHLHQQNHHLSLDSNGLIIAPTITISSSLKAPDKISIRDQLSKLQHRINELNREYQMCNEKKNEIILTMQKLDSEKTLCQLEFDRLSKCFDF